MTSEKPIMWGAAAVVLAGIAALYYFYAVRGPVQVATPPPQAHSAAPAPTEPAIEHPVPPAGESAAPPLPPLKDSDEPIASALGGVPNGAGIDKFLVSQNLIRHVVATIDNLPRKKVAVDVRPIKSTPGEFEVSGTADHLTLNPDNFKRYTPFIDLVQSIDAKSIASVYFRFYPLFQQAYEDLGYPTEYFNDRVIEVIDHLLETPDVQGPIELVQPNVMYLYADPKLEALSAGQKTLIRMGPDNAGIIKAKLRELRNLLATHAVPGQSGSGSQPGPDTSPAPRESQSAAPPIAVPGSNAPPSGGSKIAPAPQPRAAPAPQPH